MLNLNSHVEASDLQKTDGGTPNGSLKSSQVQSNPFLTTLPGRGNGQTLVTMGASFDK